MHTALATAALAAGLLAPVATGTAGAAGAPRADEPSSPIRIALDSRAAAHGGTTYAITVRNTSGRDVPHGLVTQLLPEPLDYVSATPQARTAGRQVSWRVGLPAGSSRVLTVTAAPGGKRGDGRDGGGDGPRDRAAARGGDGRDVRAADEAAGGARDARDARADDKGDGSGPASSTTVCFQGGARGQLLTCTSAGGDWPPESWVSANKVYAVGSAAAALVVGTAGIVVLRRRRAHDAEDDRKP